MAHCKSSLFNNEGTWAHCWNNEPYNATMSLIVERERDCSWQNTTHLVRELQLAHTCGSSLSLSLSSHAATLAYPRELGPSGFTHDIRADHLISSYTLTRQRRRSNIRFKVVRQRARDETKVKLTPPRKVEGLKKSPKRGLK